MSAIRRGVRRGRLLLAAGCALGLAGGATPALALNLPLPTPLPTLSPPTTSSLLPTPLPSVTPLPVVSPLIGTVTGPGSGTTTGGTGGQSSGGQGGSGSTTQSGSGGTTSGTGTSGSSGEPSASGPVSRTQAQAPLATVIGPLPAFPGLPSGAVQDVAWSLVLVIPLLLLIWVMVLTRMVMRLRHLRGSAALLSAASELGLSPREIAGLSSTALERMRDQLALDELTGCMRRASGLAALERDLARARREKSALSVGFVDADGLKHANDTLGHAAGDQLLKDVAQGLRSRLRGSDFVFRYGGDEFVCVLAGATATAAADVLMDVQKQLRLQGRSFSLGIAEFRQGDSAVGLLGRADEALYEAKRALREQAQASGRQGEGALLRTLSRPQMAPQPD